MEILTGAMDFIPAPYRCKAAILSQTANRFWKRLTLPVKKIWVYLTWQVRKDLPDCLANPIFSGYSSL